MTAAAAPVSRGDVVRFERKEWLVKWLHRLPALNDEAEQTDLVLERTSYQYDLNKRRQVKHTETKRVNADRVKLVARQQTLF